MRNISIVLLFLCSTLLAESTLLSNDLYHLPQNVKSRWASAENYDAVPSTGGQAGFSRKGEPCKRWIQPGDEFILAHAEGSGTIRRIWITINDRSPEMLRGIIIEMLWDGADKPAVQAPIGDFFCVGLGRRVPFENIWFSDPEGRSFNCVIPMPFKTGMKIIARNENSKPVDMFFYDVDFTLGDQHNENTGYFHAWFNHQNPTTIRQDYELLSKVKGRGRFLGCNFGVVINRKIFGKTWWGEGEVKMYLDGDSDFPTLNGTGTEDYVGTGWGQGPYSNLYQGCTIADEENSMYSLYRLHAPDPIYFQSDIRVTLQQIGGGAGQAVVDALKNSGVDFTLIGDGSQKLTLEQYENGTADPNRFYIFERYDDVSSTAYFYLDTPTSDLPAIEPFEKRVAGLSDIK